MGCLRDGGHRRRLVVHLLDGGMTVWVFVERSGLLEISMSWMA